MSTQLTDDNGTIWELRELRFFGFVIWRWMRPRLTTRELMRRLGI